MDRSNPLTPEIIDAAVQYVRKTCKARRKDKRGMTVYQNADGAGAMAEFVQVILDRGWLCGAVIESYLGDLRIKIKDRIICPAWRANAIVKNRPSRRQSIKKKVDAMAIAEMSACYERCELEYFATNKRISRLTSPIATGAPSSCMVTRNNFRNSCGLFLLECMEHWDGDELTAEVSQEKIDDKRERTVAKIIMAKTNLVEKAKKDVLDIAAKERA
ncbi:hypothetical protein ACQ4PT_019628 [Festuca glaucescens]